MKLELINNTSGSFLSQNFLKDFVSFMEKELQKRKILQASSNKKLVIAFVSSKEIQKLNQQFLKQDKATDVLSFSSLEQNSFGELALCMEKIKTQALDHKLTIKEEACYLILHGFLHLLGYQHEKEEQKVIMYKLQDEVFELWQCKGYKTTSIT